MLSRFFSKFFLLMIGFICFSFCDGFESSSLSSNEIFNIGIEAYIYAYPLVLMETTQKMATNVIVPNQMGKAPINQFSHMVDFPSAKFKEVVRPNADTLYSSAWLDLTKEPFILSVPNTQDRYYLMQMLDAWTNVVASIGKRTTGTKAQNFLIQGPNWKGDIPEKDFKLIKAPTNLVWLLARTQTNGPEDLKNVHKIQAEYKLIPLSEFKKDYQPPRGSINRVINMKTPPMVQVARMDAMAFFKIFRESLKKKSSFASRFNTRQSA